VAKLVNKHLTPDHENLQVDSSRNFYLDIVNYLVLLMKALAELVFHMFSYRWPVIGFSIISLPLHSQLIQQLTSRVHLLQIWENNRLHLKPKYSGPYLSRLYADSVLRTNSALFTIVNDFILGLVFLCLLNYFSADTLKIVHTLGSTIHIEVLKSEVSWLMGLPAGFKPNEALDNAVGINILRLIDYWNLVTTYLTGFEIEIVQFFAVFGLFGISFQLALLSDLIDFCTLHM
jgi:phosphatidylinositol glycan class Q protein